jgi:ribosomal protein L37E
MPYVSCPHCSLTVFNSARDFCTSCGRPLPVDAASRTRRLDLLARTASEMRHKPDARLERRFEQLSRSLAEDVPEPDAA